MQFLLHVSKAFVRILYYTELFTTPQGTTIIMTELHAHTYEA